MSTSTYLYIYFLNLQVFSFFARRLAQSIDYQQAFTKVGPDQLGPPVRVGSTRIDSDRLGS